MSGDEGPLRRVLSSLDAPDLVDQLSSLTAGDMTTLLLAVARVRAAKRTSGDVLRAYERDRFVSPSPIDG